MLCTQCVTEVPDGSSSCPRCGRQFVAPAGVAAPAVTAATALATPDTGPKDERARLAAFVQKWQQMFQQWRQRSKWIAWPVAVLAGVLSFFLLSLVVSHEGKYAGSLSMILSFFIALAVDLILEMGLLPQLTMPSLPCPYCARLLPLITNEGLFKPWKRPATCPHCRRDLPH
jgi:hypothetical protein